MSCCRASSGQWPSYSAIVTTTGYQQNTPVDAGTEAGECQDNDGDGHGRNCVEVLLSSEVTDGTFSHTPIVYDFSVTHRCPVMIQ